MLGWTLIRKEKLKVLEANYFIGLKVVEYHRWFSGWKDLDIIWDYLLGKSIYAIASVRDQYARARETDCYGETKLELENKNLRKALEKLRDGPGNKMVSWKETWAHEFASKALE